MAPLKAAINALDPAPDKKSELTLALNLLSELCQQKVDAYAAAIDSELRTAGSVENKTIPITEILASHKEYRAYVSSDAGKIATEVSAAIKNFITGGNDKIVDGVASLVTTGIEAIIGAGSGSQQELSSYYIIVQGFSLIRFDVRVWSRTIEATGITKQIENAMAIAAFKSSVDIRKISLNTFLNAYVDQLGKIGLTESDWKTYLTTAEDLYDKLAGRDNTGAPVVTTGAAVLPVHQASLGPQFRAPGQLYFS